MQCMKKCKNESLIKYIFSNEKHFYSVQASMKRINKMLFGHCTVATSPVV